MTATTTRKFAVNDVVNIPPIDGDGCDYGFIVGTPTREEYERCRDWYGPVEGTGPVYLVNVGNVFSDVYEYGFAESELSPHDDPSARGEQWDTDADGRWTPRPVSRLFPPTIGSSKYAISDTGEQTIPLTGNTAIRIDHRTRTIAVDHVSGYGDGREWTVVDLRDGTYGDFHRLKDRGSCNDPRGCADQGEHIALD